MAFALKIGDLDEDTFAASAVSTKRCSGCDPDVPGHCAPHRCLQCRGTGREPLSFQSTVTQLSASRKEASLLGSKGKSKFGYRSPGSTSDYAGDGDDDTQDLEY